MLAQTNNKVYIEGILSEVDLKPGTFIKKSDGSSQEYLGGTIKVRVNQLVDGKDVENEITVNLFASKYDKTGKISKPYDSVEKLTHMTSLAACGGDIAKADRVRFEGSFAENAFYAQDGTLVYDTRINASFVNKIGADVCVPKAVFDVDIVIGVIRDIEKDDVPTGHIAIEGLVIQYGGKVERVIFIAKKESAVKYIKNNWHKGDMVTVQGVVNYSVTTKTTTQEADFGDPIVTTKTTSVKELLVTAGGAVNDAVFTTEELNQGLAERKARIEATKDKKPAATKAAGRADLGF